MEGARPVQEVLVRPKHALGLGDSGVDESTIDPTYMTCGDILDKDFSEPNPDLSFGNNLKQFDGAVDCTSAEESLEMDNKDFTNYPVVMCTNIRSMFPKLDCLCSIIEEESIDIGFVSEVWMSETNPLHTQQLERKLHLHGLEFIANPRLHRRGGGVEIIVDHNKGYSAKKLHINCSAGGNRVEIVWALVTPPRPIGQFKSFICASFYSPPRSRLNDKLIEHIGHNIAQLTATYPHSGVFLCGDRNNIPVCSIDSGI